MDSKETAQKYFDEMISITFDTSDARDCATIMVKELKNEATNTFDKSWWDDVLKELKTTTKGLKVKK